MVLETAEQGGRELLELGKGDGFDSPTGLWR